MNLRNTFATIMLILISGTAFAVGPNLMNYQGQVLTSGGAPVANATYPASFVFYSVPVGGLPLWSEPTTITTSGGLFTHVLGSSSPIPGNLFTANPDVWLEVSVNGQMQSPRTQMMSAGNALAVSTVDKATGGILKSGIGVGEPMVNDGYIYLHSNYSPSPTAALFDYGAHGSAFALYQQNGTTYAYTYPSTVGSYGGNFYLQNGFGGIGFNVEGNYTGGSPFVSMSGFTYASFDLGAISNYSVNLPDSAISSPEILDEPGVAISTAIMGLGLTATMQDLTTVTINIPAPGYIVLDGRVAELSLAGTTGSNWAQIQIDETSGGGAIPPYHAVCGGWSFPTAGYNFYSLYCNRVYFKGTAGSYTFRLEGMQTPAAATGALASAAYPTLRAMYFPTSYGSVVTAASAADAGKFESATLLKVIEGNTTTITGAPPSNMYTVDLRELELKVAKSRAETERLARELAEARLKERVDTQTKLAAEKK